MDRKAEKSFGEDAARMLILHGGTGVSEAGPVVGEMAHDTDSRQDLYLFGQAQRQVEAQFEIDVDTIRIVALDIMRDEADDNAVENPSVFIRLLAAEGRYCQEKRECCEAACEFADHNAFALQSEGRLTLAGIASGMQVDFVVSSNF